MQVVVFRGAHKGERGTLEKKKGKHYVNNNLVREQDCWQIKTSQKKTSKGLHKVSDSIYTPSGTRLQRAEAKAVRSNEAFALDIMISAVTNKLDVQMSIKAKRGMMGVVNKGVLDTAFLSDTFTTAILNAANTSMLGGGGIDGLISDKAGDEVMQERKELPVRPEYGKQRNRVGGAIRTAGGNIQVKYIIHAVGPNFHLFENVSEGLMKLFEAYWNALNIENCDYVGMCFLSAGIFRASVPLSVIIGVAFLTVYAYLQTNVDFKLVVFAAYTKEEQELSAELMKKVRNKSTRNAYVKEFPDSFQAMYRHACKNGVLPTF